MENEQAEGPIRVRTPRKGEVLGEVTALLGASRFRVKCKDGVERMCRIPGRFRKRLKMSVGDWVIITPWPIEPEKGDIAWIYTTTQAKWLRKKGLI